MTDFSTIDNTHESDSKRSIILLHNQNYKPLSNEKFLSKTYNSRSLSPKSKRNLAFPQDSFLKELLKSSLENEVIASESKFKKKKQKNCENDRLNLINISEILNLSSQTEKKSLKSNILCLFNKDLKEFLQNKEEHKLVFDESIQNLNSSAFLDLQKRNYNKLSEIFEKISLQQKDRVLRDLLKTIKQEFDYLIRNCYDFIEKQGNQSSIKRDKHKNNDENLDVLTFDKFLLNLLEVYDIELNEKELFGILRPKKQELQAKLSRYKLMSKKIDEIYTAEKIEKKISQDFDLIFKLKTENNMLLKENQELRLLKDSFEKKSNETFRMVHDRLNLIEKRSLQQSLENKKASNNNDEIKETALENENKLQTLLEANNQISNENLGLKQHNEILRKKINRLNMEIKKLNMKNEKIYMNKEIEIKHFQENPLTKQVKSLRFLLSTPIPDIMNKSETNNSYKWTISLINLIYSQKIIQDTFNEYESKPTRKLKEILLNFFVVRFKSKYLIETILKMFLSNLKKYMVFSERVRSFVNFSGLLLQQKDYHTLDLSKEEYFPYNMIRNELYKQKSTSELFLRIIYTIRFSFLPYENSSSTNTNTNNNFIENVMESKKTFLSIEEDEGLSIEIAKNLLPQILTMEGLSENYAKDVESKFQNTLETDIFERITHYNDEVMGNSNKAFLQNSNVMRMDIFLKFVVDIILEKRLSEFQQIYTLIKLQKVNKPEVFLNLDDFRNIILEISPGNKQMHFIEKCFFEIIDELNEENHFNSTFKNIVDIYNENDFKSKNTFFFTKINSSQNNTLKNSKEFYENCKTVFSEWKSELAILLETYNLFKNIISQTARSSQKIHDLHENFLKDLKKIHKNILNMKNYDVSMIGGNKSNFLKLLEEKWNIFVDLLENCLRENMI